MTIISDMNDKAIELEKLLAEYAKLMAEYGVDARYERKIRELKLRFVAVGCIVAFDDVVEKYYLEEI